MDQRLVVGVGNIYACESLFRARLSPLRIAGGLRPAQAARLAAAIRDGAAGGDRRRRLVACATTSRPTASSASSRTALRSTAAPGCLPGLRAAGREARPGQSRDLLVPAAASAEAGPTAAGPRPNRGWTLTSGALGAHTGSLCCRPRAPRAAAGVTRRRLAARVERSPGAQQHGVRDHPGREPRAGRR